MKPEKMAAEELGTRLQKLGSELPQGMRRVHAGEVAAHIEALEAERGRLAALATEHGWYGEDNEPLESFFMKALRDDPEVPALRERVRALEKENKRLRLDVEQVSAFLRQHRDGEARAESRLAGIRQRAEDEDLLEQAVWDVIRREPWAAAEDRRSVRALATVTARYLVGEDNPGAPGRETPEASIAEEEARRICEEAGIDTKAQLAKVMEMVAAKLVEQKPVPNPPEIPESSPPLQETQCSAHPGKTCDPETPGVYECRCHAPTEPTAGRTCDRPGHWGRPANGAGKCDECRTGVTPEPTTAEEEFATVREALEKLDGYESYNENEVNPVAETAKQHLSLLERRMGAMERVLRAARMVCEDVNASSTVARIDAALTDVPPVFTLEEVEGAVTQTAAGVTITHGQRIEADTVARWVVARLRAADLATLRRKP